jgi:hypothetical protein
MPPIPAVIANPTSRPTPGAIVNSGTYRRWGLWVVALSTGLTTAGVCGETPTGSGH